MTIDYLVVKLLNHALKRTLTKILIENISKVEVSMYFLYANYPSSIALVHAVIGYG